MKITQSIKKARESQKTLSAKTHLAPCTACAAKRAASLARAAAKSKQSA